MENDIGHVGMCALVLRSTQITLVYLFDDINNNVFEQFGLKISVICSRRRRDIDVLFQLITSDIHVQV
jgi:hypothetical protein